MSKASFAGTATIAFAFVNAVKLVPYYFLGQLSFESLKVGAILAPASVVSVFIGVRIVKWLPEKVFFTLINWALSCCRSSFSTTGYPSQLKQNFCGAAK